MRILRVLLLLATLAPVSALAMGGDMERIRLGAYYGLSSISPTDLNNKATAQSANYTPKFNSITSGSLYGAQLEYMLNHRVSIEGMYEFQNAQNAVNVTSPSAVSSAGYNVTFNQALGGLNYYLIDNGRVMFGIGVFAILPTYAHVTETLPGATNQYDTDKNLGVMGQARLGVMLGKYFSLMFEAGYQSLSESNAKTGTGQYLTTSTGSNVRVDLSGIRADAGLSFHF